MLIWSPKVDLYSPNEVIRYFADLIGRDGATAQVNQVTTWKSTILEAAYFSCFH
jgi:hypothetical protein